MRACRPNNKSIAPAQGKRHLHIVGRIQVIRRTVLAPVVLGLGLSLVAACGPTHSDSGKAKALASSTAGQLAKKDAKAALAGCMPTGEKQTSALAWRSALAKCEIPKGNRLVAAECIVKNLTAVKLPPKSEPDARNTAIVNAAFPCYNQYKAAS